MKCCLRACRLVSRLCPSATVGILLLFCVVVARNSEPRRNLLMPDLSGGASWVCKPRAQGRGLHTWSIGWSGSPVLSCLSPLPQPACNSHGSHSHRKHCGWACAVLSTGHASGVPKVSLGKEHSGHSRSQAMQSRDRGTGSTPASVLRNSHAPSSLEAGPLSSSYSRRSPQS